MNDFKKARQLITRRYLITNLVTLLMISSLTVFGYWWSEESELKRQLERQVEWLVNSPYVPADSEGLREELDELSVSSAHPLGYLITRTEGGPPVRFGLLSIHEVSSEAFLHPDQVVFRLSLQQEPCLALVAMPSSPYWSRVMIVISTREIQQNTRSLGLILITVSALATCVLFFLAHHLSNQALRPTQQSYRKMQKSLADASHELRTPLTAIMGEAEVALRHPREPEAYREALSCCAAYSRQMLAVVEGVLELSRADAEIPIMDVQWVDLGQLVASEVEQLLRTLPQAPHLSVTESQNLIVEGDPELLTRALRNVLENAIRHTPANGRIDVVISRSRDAKTAILSVADSGCGIAADELPFIFDRFYRGSNSITHENRGTGLGLAIVKALIEAHHGSVQVSSQLGEGTTLTIKLPIKPI